MKKLKKVLLMLLVLVLITSCADVVSVEECTNTEPYGFWSGLWHGVIIGFAFIGSLFNNDIAIYAINNTDTWYDFGFILGIGGFTGSSAGVLK